MATRRELVLRAAGVLQAIAFAVVIAGAVRGRAAASAAFDPQLHAPSGLGQSDAAVWLPPLFAEIPRDAHVVIVGESLQAVPFEMHALPRPTDVLIRCNERALTPRPHVSAAMLESVRAIVDGLERSGRRFTPERYAAALARSRYLLLFCQDVSGLFPDQYAFKLLREFGGTGGHAAVYEVQRR